MAVKDSYVGTEKPFDINKTLPKNSVFNKLPCVLPKSSLGINTSPESVVAQFKDKLGSLSQGMFVPDAVWRDTFALTGTLRTFYSASTIASAWSANCNGNKATRFKLALDSAQAVQIAEDCAWVTASFSFETDSKPSTNCCGYLDLVLTEDGLWKIWMLRTMLDQIKGLPNVDELEHAKRCSPDDGKNHANGIAHEADGAGGELDSPHFDCVIVGGGQAGLSVAGRLQSLGVNYMVLEKYEMVGDNWKYRYDSAKLHLTKECAHLPFERTFPDPYPEYLTKDDLAEGYKAWVQKFGINLWTSTELKSGSWDDQQRRWTLLLARHGKEQIISAIHVVMAVGGGGQIPVMPSYPDKDKYKGLVLHSAQFQSANAWKGLNGIVIGTANTAHDVAEDMLEAGLNQVTMIQRQSTYVVPGDHLGVVLKRYYNPTLPTKLGDSLYLSLPIGVASLLGRKVLSAMADADPEPYNALQRAGFKLERYGNVDHNIYERSGGHYVDVGCSKKIADGKIKIKSDALACRYVEDGLEFEDGSRLKADVIVFATGFLGNVRTIVRSLFGTEVASRADDYWGLDSDGEVKGAFKRQKQPGLWYIGGTLIHARYYSRHLALQIKADLIGTPFRVDNETYKST